MNDEDPQNEQSFVLRVVENISEFTANEWNSLVGASRQDINYNPFITRDFLLALEKSGSVSQKAGWLPRHLRLEDDQGRLIGAVPNYLKGHSQGNMCLTTDGLTPSSALVVDTIQNFRQQYLSHRPPGHVCSTMPPMKARLFAWLWLVGCVNWQIKPGSRQRMLPLRCPMKFSHWSARAFSIVQISSFTLKQ